jgi:SAM-dependent MidA family methyltransferase
MTPEASVAAELASRIARRGPVPFAEVVDLALYHSELGFYSSGGAAGRDRGDFLTSPEVGPLFGTVMARAIDGWWRELGEPERFTVVEAAAGTGTMARSVLAAEPACSRALTYVLVERAAALRRRHRDHLPLVDAPFAFAPSDPGPPLSGRDAPPARRASDRGPIVVSLGELPAGSLEGVILANELLDNLPFAVLERTADGWSEVFVGLSDREGEGSVPELVEVLEPASDADTRLISALAPDAELGARVPCQRAAAAWLGDALTRLEAGRVVVLDYGAGTAELARRGPDRWLRTYRDHHAGGPPLTDLGGQDITCDVAFDQLARVREPARRQRQAEFLRQHGIDGLVEEGRRIWAERGHLGDLAAVKGRSRVREADALLDPQGLGGFEVLEWVVRSPGSEG